MFSCFSKKNNNHFPTLKQPRYSLRKGNNINPKAFLNINNALTDSTKHTDQYQNTDSLNTDLNKPKRSQFCHDHICKKCLSKIEQSSQNEQGKKSVSEQQNIDSILKEQLESESQLENKFQMHLKTAEFNSIKVIDQQHNAENSPSHPFSSSQISFDLEEEANRESHFIPKAMQLHYQRKSEKKHSSATTNSNLSSEDCISIKLQKTSNQDIQNCRKIQRRKSKTTLSFSEDELYSDVVLFSPKEFEIKRKVNRNQGQTEKINEIIEIKEIQQYNNDDLILLKESQITLQNFKVSPSKINSKDLDGDDDSMNQSYEQAENTFYCDVGTVNQQFIRALTTKTTFSLAREIYKKMNIAEKNQKDFKGYTPISAAILKTLKNLDFMNFTKEMIYDNDIDLHCKSPLGWSPIQEAIFYRNIPLTTHLFRAIENKKRNQLLQSFSGMASFLQRQDDFYLEINADVKSFIPLMSSFTPGDVIRLWKKGNKLRMDYTLVGYEYLSCKRRQMSCIFDGSSLKLYAVNNSKQTYCDLMEPIDHQEMALLIEDLLSTESKKVDPIIHSVELKKAYTIFDNQIVETFASLPAVKHIMEIVYTSTTEKRKSKLDPQKTQLEFINTFDQYKLQEHPIKIKEKNKNKKIELQLFLAEDFKLQIKNLVQMFEVLALGNEVILKCRQFLKEKILNKIQLDNVFPVKIAVPLAFSIYFDIEFNKYCSLGIENQQQISFEIPKNYELLSRKEYQKIKDSKEKRAFLIKAYA